MTFAEVEESSFSSASVLGVEVHELIACPFVSPRVSIATERKANVRAGQEAINGEWEFFCQHTLKAAKEQKEEEMQVQVDS